LITGHVSNPAFLYWHDLTAPQIQSLAPEAVVIIPLGATEQHGPHLCTGTDTIISEAILRELHKQPPDSGIYLQLPTQAVGASDHHISFGGTLSIPPLLFSQLLIAQVRCLVSQGHRRIVLFNAHGGNIAPMQTALAELAVELNEIKVIAGCLSYWQLARESWEQIPEFSGRSLTHACEFETSMIYAARPDLIRNPTPQKKEWNDTVEARCSLALPFSAMTEDGSFGDPGSADAALGSQLINTSSDAFRSFLVDFSTYDPFRMTPCAANSDS